ncbi:MAG: polysaccharide deacetylase family protein [Streptococcaceae bacterium]|jgi:peptidoglycan/xylan/chitin deacetylase (PgdA/CDA1 family)|nr:polysaccharide deacetylase family protein [Streptococcaceae bacterium]
MNRKKKWQQKRKIANIKFSLIMILLIIIVLTPLSYFTLTGLNKTQQVKKEITSVSKQKIKKTKESISKSQAVKSTINSNNIDTSKWIPSQEEAWVPTLMYHHITHEITDNNCLTPEDFEFQLDTLKKDGYTSVSPEEAYLIFTENKKPAKKVICLTFDDGFDDFYKNAYPLLKKYNMKATSFVVTNFLNKINYLTDPQILEMKKSGLISFQSHTASHQSMESLNVKDQLEQLQTSKKHLDNSLKQETLAICYPAGKFDEHTANLANQAGYKLGFTTQSGFAAKSDGLLTLSRVRINSNMTGEEVLNVLKTAENH